jgi:hypothetical protein
MEYPICKGHCNCEEKGCRTKTNIEKGTCDCEFKANCHLVRQHLQGHFKTKNPEHTKLDCWFYSAFLGQL